MGQTNERDARRGHGTRRCAAEVLALVLATGGSAACGGEGGSEGGDRPAPSTAPAAAAEASPGDADRGPWRFVPTLEQHLPAGAVGVPVLELSQPRRYQVVIVAAVLRAGAEHVELERWAFAQNPDGESLRLVEGGEAVLRLRPGPRSPKLVELRRELAAPGVVLTRPIGLASEPRALLDALATAFGTLRDAKAEPRARVEAAATVMRGLDDTVVFERDAIGEVAGLLHPMPAELEVEVLAERRARARLVRPGGTATLALQRKSDGWAITAVELVEAAAPPSDAGSTGGTG